MDKVDEINHSQTLENVKSSTSHAWTKTKEVSYDAAEKTKVLAMKINEDMKPVSEKVVHNAKIGWDYASETVKTTTDIAIDVTTKAVQNISSVLSENEEES